ncbi:hypothetical protein PLEOSDRAFT_1101535 [Pleurotus ostreatus PC15]|uniref:SAGA-associated factor 11 n=1 Tax=Pleurotus ostreatus (strain PC15) TaxID=1137138 RepID=A0A067NRJ5_PLEO1|nr:hypothetical protein PLEOSDRAFT_1101535 [Pleurotus ostreatus PC15]
MSSANDHAQLNDLECPMCIITDCQGDKFKARELPSCDIRQTIKTMRKSEREELVNELASRLMSSMVDDLVFDATIQAHQEIARSRAICSVCHTRCAAVHVPGPSNIQTQTTAGSSRAGTPMSVGNGSDSGAYTPGNSKSEGVVNLECMNCDRQVAFNRYANHLSQCMGVNGSSRRGLSRAGSNTSKSKALGEPSRSMSPASDFGNISDDAKKGGNKRTVKTKGKRDEAEFDLKRKRPNSPQTSPVKKPKKKATGGPFPHIFTCAFDNSMDVASPVSRLKSDLDNNGLPSNQIPQLPSTNSISRVPSKLRASSTSTFLDRSPSSSRSSSPDVASVATIATSSSFSGPRSPGFSSKGIFNKPPKKVTGTGPPRRLSPPRPPPPPAVPLDYAIGEWNPLTRLH